MNKASPNSSNCNFVKWYLLPGAEALRTKDNFLPFVDIPRVTFTIRLQEATKRILNQFPASLLRLLNKHSVSPPATSTEQWLVDRYGQSSCPSRGYCYCKYWIHWPVIQQVTSPCGLHVSKDSSILPTHFPRIFLWRQSSDLTIITVLGG
jgi:hypothetical protein